MKLTILFILTELFAFIYGQHKYYCTYENIKGKWQLRIVSRACCDVSPKQWEIIAWYFKRVNSYIDVTEVIREKKKVIKASSTFSSDFARELYPRTGLDCYSKRVDYSYYDEMVDKAEPHAKAYKWHAELSKISSNNETYVTDTSMDIRRRIPSKSIRMDEPDKGVIVLTQDIAILDSYLNGESRHPFIKKRAHYIIFVYKEINDQKHFDKLASSVVTKLWVYHGILNAIILSSCKNESIGYYDPFVDARELGLKNVNHWGVFNYLPVDLLDPDDAWILQKEDHMNRFPLTFSVFERYPSMISNFSNIFDGSILSKVMNKIGYGGIDGLILGSLAEILEFKAVVVQPNSTDTYGHRTADGVFTGTLGDILYGRADAAFNSRFLIEYSSTDIEYLLPTLGDKVCVVAPAAQKIPQWRSIFRYFDAYFWLAFLVAGAVATATHVWFNRYEVMRQRKRLRRSVFYAEFKRFAVEKRFSVRKIYMTVVKAIIGMSTSLPFVSRERLVIGACLLANRIISGHFEGLLYNVYTKPLYYDDINTLADLDKSALRISIESHALRNLFGGNETGSEMLLSLNEKFRYYHTVERAINRAATVRDVCSVERYSDINTIIQTKYLNADGSPQLHLVAECPRHYFLTYITRRDWPFLPKFNKVLFRLAEGGFTKHWQETTASTLIRRTYAERDKFKEGRPFTLKNVETPFYLLLVGYVVSTIVFLAEKFVMPPHKLRKITQKLGLLAREQRKIRKRVRNRSINTKT